MPVYQYKCQDCQHVFDKKLRISERTVPIDDDCPSCDSKGHIQQVIGTPLVSYSTNPGMRITSSFNDRMKDIKKTKGEGCTIDPRGVS